MSTSMLLDEIEFFLTATGLGPNQFGRAVCNDPRFVSDVRAGRSVGRDSTRRVRGWMRQNLPLGMAWPKFEPAQGAAPERTQPMPISDMSAICGSLALVEATDREMHRMAAAAGIPARWAMEYAHWPRAQFEASRAAAA
jgi:hypothetical protein